MRTLFFLAAMSAGLSLFAQHPAIIPQPVSTNWHEGKFIISPSTVLVADTSDKATVNFFNSYLDQVYGFHLKQVGENRQPASNFIRLYHHPTKNPGIVPGPDGRYTMQVSGGSVVITGDTHTGTFYGMQTLIQLLPVSLTPKQYRQKLEIPAVSVEDYPRFGYRGLMLDVGRHFFPVEVVKRYIDYLALHKMNYFHWHLTEDQGWRIEIKKYPLLTQVGAWRSGTIIGHHPGTGNDSTPHGGFYTQEQIKEVVKYAADRYVTILPEIELPGHASAALTAYPYLGCTGGPYHVQQTWGVFDDVYCAGNDSVFQFLQDVMDEVLPLFPGKYIHIGGDECPKVSWKKCPKCQRRIKEHGLKDEHELQSYFVSRMEKYINSKGKQIIGWDEILEGGLAPNASVMSWRGEKGGIEAARQNHDVVMTPTTYVYFDYSQRQNDDSLTIGGYLPLERIYSYEPIPSELSAEEAKHIKGAQANLWTEYIDNKAKIEYMIFPRASALSEVLWSPKEARNWTDFQRRLQTQYARYQLWRSSYYRTYVKPQDTAVQQKLAQWQDSKFGLMMHWGPYSQWGVVESWSICPEDEGWTQRRGPHAADYNDYVTNYRNLQTTFNPKSFDPAKWAAAAKDAGMKYVVFTTKHHDGFAMFDTKQSDYKITSSKTPFSSNPKSNVAKEVFDAFRQKDFMIGAYFSKPDWNSADYWWPYFPPKDRNVNYDPARYPDRWKGFKDYTYNQIEELMTGYGKMDILWLDGGWVRPLNTNDGGLDREHGFDYDQDIDMARIAGMARKNQPGLIVVDRSVPGEFENYETPEQQVPTHAIQDYPWETCMTMGNSWSYVPNDKYKSATELIQLLVKIVSRGGNFLLNVGPSPDGEFDAAAYDRLKEIGQWMKVNGEGIYNSKPRRPYSGADEKVFLTQSKDEKAVYAFFTEPTLPAEITIKDLKIPAKTKVSILGNKAAVKWRQSGKDVIISVPGVLQNKAANVTTFKLR